MVSNIGTSTACPRPDRARSTSAAQMALVASSPVTLSDTGLRTNCGSPRPVWVAARPDTAWMTSS